jgi:hypothetical protein
MRKRSIDSRYLLIASWAIVFVAILITFQPELGIIILAFLVGIFSGVAVANISIAGETEPDLRAAALNGLAALFIIASILLMIYEFYWRWI